MRHHLQRAIPEGASQFNAGSDAYAIDLLIVAIDKSEITQAITRAGKQTAVSLSLTID